MPASAAPASLPAICPTPITADTRATTVTVGSGTAASCTETALANALAKGGVIRFNCGGPATITLTSQKTLRIDVNTTIDGQGKITLDGRGTTRLLHYSSPNFQATNTTVTIQNITLQNGAASGTPLPVAPAPCSQGTETDVGGGAIYALGSLGITVVGSTFQSNRAANGGAIGALFGNLSIYNSQFSSNKATGSGANSIKSTCHVRGGESGNGGNGGAVVIDGSEKYAVNVCGSTFTANAAGSGAFGGAIFRTPNGAMQTTTIDRSAFTGNTAPSGGALYFHNSNLVVKASTLSGNTANIGGALFADGTTLNFSNDTFVGNVTEKGLGGAIFLSGNGGSIQTIAPLLGSPAIGIGQNCPPTDQRGVARPLNGCTAGAVEGALP